MTDLEIARKCAEKMKLPLAAPERSAILWIVRTLGGIPHYESYDPRHDDAQCMALIKAFPDEVLEALTYMVDRHPRGTLPPGDLFNRTVCECVARMT